MGKEADHSFSLGFFGRVWELKRSSVCVFGSMAGVFIGSWVEYYRA